MKILFIGESWLGSCARSLKEALFRQPGVDLDEVSEDAFFPGGQARWLRALNRLTRAQYQREFEAFVLRQQRLFQPDVILTYKGWQVGSELIATLQRRGVLTANFYPDHSPHRYGKRHQDAVGNYDLVISSKQFHPGLWQETYGYSNRCVFCPQGYDPGLHLVAEAPTEFASDVVIVARHRPEYEQLLVEFAEALQDPSISVTVGGDAWDGARAALPSHWVFTGDASGRAYVRLVRSGKICIAPVTRSVVINGQRQPGDVDTTRTYELAAAHCFFVHRRTDYAMKLYAPDEVPMFNDAAELARHVEYYLAHDAERVAMAARAHRRAVPAYSQDARAAEVVQILRGELDARYRYEANATG